MTMLVHPVLIVLIVISSPRHRCDPSSKASDLRHPAYQRTPNPHTDTNRRPNTTRRTRVQQILHTHGKRCAINCMEASWRRASSVNHEWTSFSGISLDQICLACSYFQSDLAERHTRSDRRDGNACSGTGPPPLSTEHVPRPERSAVNMSAR
jgi:hypothetical protein